MGSVGSGRSQEPQTSFGSPMWVWGSKHMGCFSQAMSQELDWSRADRTRTGTHMGLFYFGFRFSASQGSVKEKGK